jgi:ubiquinone biosynthesis protein UbiJ
MPDPFDRPLIAALNHLLDPADWARRRLATHAGKRVCIRMAGAERTLAVDAAGRFTPAEPGDPDLCLDIPLAAAVALRAGRTEARRSVRTVGDAALAADLAYVAAHLSWDGEADLARLVGDVAARRIAVAARALARLPADAATTLARSAGRFAVDERSMLPDRTQVDGWADAVDRLRDDVERLAARLERLERGARR